MLLAMANNSAQLTAAVASLATSQAPFMRSAADADAKIGLSKSHSLLLVEQIAARESPSLLVTNFSTQPQEARLERFFADRKLANYTTVLTSTVSTDSGVDTIAFGWCPHHHCQPSNARVVECTGSAPPHRSSSTFCMHGV
jgi:hypothetical protein